MEINGDSIQDVISKAKKDMRRPSRNRKVSTIHINMETVRNSWFLYDMWWRSERNKLFYRLIYTNE